MCCPSFKSPYCLPKSFYPLSIWELLTYLACSCSFNRGLLCRGQQVKLLMARGQQAHLPNSVAQFFVKGTDTLTSSSTDNPTMLLVLYPASPWCACVHTYIHTHNSCDSPVVYQTVTWAVRNPTRLFLENKADCCTCQIANMPLFKPAPA